MTEEVFFQWQNEFLLKTIYPLREMKLRDFLVYYQEIDLWKEYKDQDLENLKDEIQAYKDAQAGYWAQAYQTFRTLRDYFTIPDVTEPYRKKYPNLDANQMAKINALHGLFKKFFLTYNNVAKERYFLAQRVYEWEQNRKSLLHTISENQRKLRNMGATWVHRAKYETETQILITQTVPMTDEELNRLYTFLSAFSTIEKRRLNMKKWRDKSLSEQNQLAQKLNNARAQEIKASDLLQAAEDDLRRLKSPPNYTTLEGYFFRLDVSTDLRSQQVTDQNLINKINELHRSLKLTFQSFPNPSSKALAVKNQIFDLMNFQRQIEKDILKLETDLRNMPSNWSKRSERETQLRSLRDVNKPIVTSELRKLYDLQAALSSQGKTPAELQGMIIQKENARREAELSLKKIRDEIAVLDDQLRAVTLSLNLPEEEQLTQFTATQPVTKQDIVNGKVETYKKELSSKNQGELLELVFKRFMSDPGRYPLWLQYMVVHFSGMRYQSAHGSWADPKTLLLTLRTKAIEKEINAVNDDGIEALCLEKINSYAPTPGVPGNQDAPIQLPRLAGTNDKKWRSKIDLHIKGMKSLSPSQRRKSYFDLRIDEEDYSIDLMGDKEALVGLEAMKGEIPDWMWKEIVRLTDLRLTEVKDPNWETLSQENQDERLEYRNRHYRQLMEQWKQENLTGWREEHDRANRLIVTRAVCNEVAEHIQHLRGHSPSGGLTAKPEWYMRKEREFDKKGSPAEENERPFFVKPRVMEHFKQGASILWLRFVPDQPNPWRIAYPLTLKNGEGLLTPTLFSGEGRPNLPGTWDYEQDPGGGWFKRSRDAVDAQNHKFNEVQWLRWMHEATVAEVAETADGPTVLTFETALPYEDKRQATIGIFKHSFYDLKYIVDWSAFIGTFTGYLPEKDVPLEDLEKMLDWNHILRKPVLNDAQRRDYINKITRRGIPAQPTIPSTPDLPRFLMEAAPRLTQSKHTEWIAGYDVDPASQKATLYKPDVSVKRGAQMYVSKADGVKIGLETYYRVSECQSEPRLEDHYVRAGDVLPAIDTRWSLPVAVKSMASLKLVSGADAGGKPLLSEANIRVDAGTTCRVSAVHKLSSQDTGNGIVSVGGKGYYLILDCPGKDNTHGLFIPADLVGMITEQEYTFGAIQSSPQEAQKLTVKASPPQGIPAIPLFRDSGNGLIAVSGTDKIVKDVQFTVQPQPEFRKEEAYYKILEYAGNPGFTGKYVRVSEVTLVLKELEEER